MILTLDLHPVFRSDRDIDQALRGVMFEALRVRATTIEIISGKGSGQLKKRVLAFLAQKHIKKMYDHVEVEADPNNTGRVLVHLRWR